MYTVTCTQVHVHSYMYTVTCTQLHVHSYMYTVTCTQLHVHSYMYTVTCTQLHVHRYMYTAIRTQLYVHSHILYTAITKILHDCISSYQNWRGLEVVVRKCPTMDAVLGVANYTLTRVCNNTLVTMVTNTV